NFRPRSSVAARLVETPISLPSKTPCYDTTRAVPKSTVNA
ncbi:MAG: hypothetical protein ACI9IN_001569, partial [Porticoccaceae bacterium]